MYELSESLKYLIDIHMNMVLKKNMYKCYSEYIFRITFIHRRTLWLK